MTTTPSGAALGNDLLETSLSRRLATIATPIVCTALFFVFAALGLPLFAIAAVALQTFFSFGSSSHDLVHSAIGLPRAWNAFFLSLIEALGLRSGTAYRFSHLHHHARFPHADDIEAWSASRSLSAALLDGPFTQPRLWRWTWRRYPQARGVLLAEAFAILAILALSIALLPWTAAPLLYCALVIAGSWTFPLITVWIPHIASGRTPLQQTRAFRGPVLHWMFAGHLYHLEHHLYPKVPHQHWPELARRLDPFFDEAGIEPVRGLRNLLPVSKRYPRIEDVLPRNTPGALFAFRVRHALRVFARLPLMLARHLAAMVWSFTHTLLTWNRPFALLGGSLRVQYLDNLVSLGAATIFGERLTLLQYRDAIVDPGPAYARSTVLRNLPLPRPSRWEGAMMRAILLTHSHEEHVGNADAVTKQTGAPVLASAITAAALRNPERLSRARRWIGQPEPMQRRVDLLGSPRATLLLAELGLEVLESPGHCAGHVSFYDPKSRVLLAGDSFLHEIFTAPNADVDGDAWIETLERYAELDIAVLVGCHGAVTTLRPNAGHPLIVDRRNPNDLIRGKLAFLRFARDLVAEADLRGLPRSIVEAAIFPWTWQNWIGDELARLLSRGEFSRTRFVDSMGETIPVTFFSGRRQGAELEIR